MFKLLAFLLVLCILFGVETTRELFFGTVGFIFWAIIITVGIGLLALGLRDGRTAEEKKKDEELDAKRKKDAEELNKNIPWWWYIIAGIIFYAFMGFILPALLH